MAAYAALVSLMNNLEQIQRHTRLPISLDPDQMESLHEKVTFLIDFLEGYSHGDREKAQDLEHRIIDAAYAAEDIIETHVVDRIISHSRSIPKKREKIIAYLRSVFPHRKNKMVTSSTGQTRKNPTLSYLPGIEKVLEDMDFIKDEVMKIEDKSKIEDLQLDSTITAPSSSSITIEKSTLVGFNDELMQIMEQLTGHQSSRQIISIVGMGGMGKTTLAKNAYENPVIVQNFYVRAWVSISQEYSLRQILLELLCNESRQLMEMNEDQLKDILYKSLCGMRYLVVLDDMWSVEVWEMVKMLFPDNNNGSRILVTTRISSVATYFGPCSIKMNLLDDDKGWNLLCRKVFVQEGCPLELEEVGRKIVKNCKGLPLSIVVIGGLLARSERTNEYWEYISRDTSSIISVEGDEQCMKILSLSYHNLPIHLKSCFLYLGAFPEDERIRVSWLIKLWVAEGFLRPNSSKELEVFGEECLNDLVDRNLIFVYKRGSDGKIKYCKIHDLLRDLCLREAHKEKFLYIPEMHNQDMLQCISSQRRISIHRRSSNEKYIPQVLNTLTLVSLARSLIFDGHEVFPLQNLRLLRVLKLIIDKYNNRSVEYSPYDIFQLVNSRFIAFNTTLRPRFPSSLCLLWNLQILIVQHIKGSPNLEIWEMTELRHLDCSPSIHLPDPPSQQMNTRGGDAILKNLQTLKTIVDFRCSDEVVKRIPNVKRLKISYYFAGSFKEFRLKNLVLLEKLESLTCMFHREMSPNRYDVLSNLAFPMSLKKLTLMGCTLPWEDTAMVGSLPHLEVLKLRYDAFEGPEWVTVEGGFLCLKYLEIEFCVDLVHWKSESTHFPCLQHLFLRRLYELEEIPSGFGEITTLQSIKVDFCSKSSVISAKKILEEQEDFGNEDLQVRVFCDMKDELESLASDNFLVRVFGKI